MQQEGVPFIGVHFEGDEKGFEEQVGKINQWIEKIRLNFSYHIKIKFVIKPDTKVEEMVQFLKESNVEWALALGPKDTAQDVVLEEF